MKIKTINYYLIIILLTHFVIDVIFTSIVLKNPGFKEENPFGFTTTSVLISLLVILFIIPINYIKIKSLLYVLSIALLIQIIKWILVVSSNIIILFTYGLY